MHEVLDRLKRQPLPPAVALAVSVDGARHPVRSREGRHQETPRESVPLPGRLTAGCRESAEQDNCPLVDAKGKLDRQSIRIGLMERRQGLLHILGAAVVVGRHAEGKEHWTRIPHGWQRGSPLVGVVRLT